MLKTIRQWEESAVAMGLDDALVGWVVESAGSGLVDWLRGDPARAALRKVVEEAVDQTVDEFVGGTDAENAEHLRASLLVRDVAVDSGRIRVRSESELREALQAWTTALDHREYGQSGYLSQLDVDADRLAEALTRRIVDGIRRNGRGGGVLNPLAEWLWRDQLSTDVDVIRRSLSYLAEVVEPPSPSGRGLPGGTPYFTGRRQLLDELAERLRAHDPAGTVLAIHVIDGMAGVGKTEFALRAAHQHKHRYPDGQYFIDLHGYTDGVSPMPPAAALEELLRQAGVPGPQIPVDLTGRQARWQALMATQRALVLLDNALDVDQLRPLLPNSAGCLVLITSRTRFPGLPGAKALGLDVPPLDEAVELFAGLANCSRTLDREAVSTVVDLVGRLPVAVQAVAGLIDDSCTEADLVNELADVQATTGLVNHANVLEPQVRAAFETSLHRLSEPHQRAFQILGVHPGPTIGVPQFAALAALPIASARETLRELAKRNLIKPSRDRAGRRYELHDLLRAFARTQAESHLSVKDRSVAITRLTIWYTTAMTVIARLLNATGGDLAGSEVDGLDLEGSSAAHLWMAAEENNLLAFAETVTAGGAGRGPRPDGRAAADVCKAAAWNLYCLNYYASAQVLYRSAADIYGEIGEREGEADARRGLGEVARFMGDDQAAVEHYRAAQALFTQIGDHAGEAVVRWGLGEVARFTGDLRAAGEHYRAAQALFTQIGSREGQADARVSLGEIARMTSDFRGAAGHYQAAATIFAQIGNRHGEAQARWGLGEVARFTEDYPVAAEHFHAAQNTFAQIGDRLMEALAWRCLGAVAGDTGDYPAAIEHCRTAQRLCQQIGHRRGEAEAQSGLGEIALDTGDYPSAVEYYRAAETLWQQIGDRTGEAIARLGLGEVARLIGDLPASAEHYQAAQTMFVQIGNRHGKAEALSGMGHIAQALGQPEEAREQWTKALRIYEEIGSPSVASVHDLLDQLELH